MAAAINERLVSPTSGWPAYDRLLYGGVSIFNNEEAGSGKPGTPVKDILINSLNVGAAWLSTAVLKWERHTEFVRYMFIVRGAERQPFAEPAIEAVPADWVAGLPGQVLVASHAVLLKAPARPRQGEKLSQALFSGNTLIGSTISGGTTTAGPRAASA